MGRLPKTAEDRAASLPEGTVEQLEQLLAKRDAARRFAELAEVDLRVGVAEVVQRGASLRDVASTLGVPHQTAHGWVKRL